MATPIESIETVENFQDKYMHFTRDSLVKLEENAINYDRKQKTASGAADDGRFNMGESSQEPEKFFEDGQELPDDGFPKNLVNLLLEDYDPYYTKRGKKTFCIVSKRFGTNYTNRYSATNSFFIFSPFNPIRYWSIRTTLHPAFDPLIILVILANCVFLALDEEIVLAEYIFTGIYTIEMILKLIARGFLFHPFSYLRDPWNWLDFIVVILAYAAIVPSGLQNVTALRTFRVFRAFRTISIVPGLKLIIDSLLHSIKDLAEVLLIMTFLLIVLSLIGLQAFQGILRRRCVRIPLPGELAARNESFLAYSTNPDNWNPVEQEEQVVCGTSFGTGFCPTNFVCSADVANNPNFGYTGFDNMGLALLTSFQLITLDFWENVYNLIIRAEGPFNILFFLLSVFLGPFYLLNLLLAVVAIAYNREVESQEDIKAKREKFKQEQARKKKEKKLQRKSMNKIAPSNSETDTSKRVLFASNQQNISVNSNDSSKKVKKSKWLKRLERFQACFHRTFCCWKCSPCFQDFQTILIKLIDSKWFEAFIMGCIFLNTISLAVDHFGISAELENALEIANMVFTFIFTIEAVIKIIGLGPITYIIDLWNDFDFFVVVISLVEFGIQLSGGSSTNTGLTVLRTFRLLRVFRLAKMWGTMRKLIEIIGTTFGAVLYLSLVLFLILYVFAVIGKQLFGPQYAQSANLFPDNAVPRWNFVNFYHGFLLVWRVMCGEWIEPLYECLHITGGSALCFIVFIAIFIVANFMVLNLFTAILLAAFTVDNFKKRKEEQEKQKKEKREIFLKLSVIEAFRKGVISKNILKRNKENNLSELQTQRRESQVSTNDVSENPKKKFKKFIDKALRQERLKIVKEYEKEYELKNIHSGTEDAPINDDLSELENSNRQTLRNTNTTMDTEIDYRFFSNLYCCCYLSRENNQTESSSIVSKELQSDSQNGENIITSTVVQEEHPENNEQTKFIPPYCFPKRLRQKFSLLESSFDSSVFRYWLLIRKACFRLVDHPNFDWFILLLIVGSTVSLAMEDAFLDSDPTRKQILQKLEYIFSALFTIEMLLKWIGFGLTDYFTSVWCFIDFFIVVISWVGIILDATNQSGNIDAFRSLRTLRALRPLRAISKWEGMRVVVNSLVNSIPAIGNVFLVCLLIWFVFGIMGVQLFKGRFFRCVDANGERIDDGSITTKELCISANQSWINPNVNFDNVAIAMVALFQVATFEGWLEIMADASDITGIDLQPIRENSELNLIFFVVFVLIGSFFILNLIVGVIIESFQKLRKETDSSTASEMFVTESQKQFQIAMKTLLNKKPKQAIPEPKNSFQLVIYKLVVHPKFEMGVFILICFNMLSLSMEHYQMTQTWETALQIADYVFTSLFAIEAILKIIGLRNYYFEDAFNNFDFLIILVSILGFALESLLSLIVSPTLLRIIRVIRVFRVLRVVRAAKGIRNLIITLLISVPALFNIAILLSIFLVIFAIIGMNLFMHVGFGGGLNNLVNFQTFVNSMILLFRLVTSAGWNEILDPLMNERNCTPPSGSDPGDCGDPVAAVIYFVIFIFLMFLIIVNMYIAIILENFEDILQQDMNHITPSDVELFYSVWAQYDPKATQFVTLQILSDFLHKLKPPLQIPKPNFVKIRLLDLPILPGDRVHCSDVLFALLKRVMSDDFTDEMKSLAEDLFSMHFEIRKKISPETTTLELPKRERAAKVIQRFWRATKESGNTKQIKWGKLLQEMPAKHSAEDKKSTTTLKIEEETIEQNRTPINNTTLINASTSDKNQIKTNKKLKEIVKSSQKSKDSFEAEVIENPHAVLSDTKEIFIETALNPVRPQTVAAPNHPSGTKKSEKVFRPLSASNPVLNKQKTSLVQNQIENSTDLTSTALKDDKSTPPTPQLQNFVEKETLPEKSFKQDNADLPPVFTKRYSQGN